MCLRNFIIKFKANDAGVNKWYDWANGQMPINNKISRKIMIPLFNIFFLAYENLEIDRIETFNKLIPLYMLCCKFYPYKFYVSCHIWHYITTWEFALRSNNGLCLNGLVFCFYRITLNGTYHSINLFGSKNTSSNRPI